MTISNEAFEAAKKVHNEALPYLTMHARLRVALEAAAPIIRAEALEAAADEFDKRCKNVRNNTFVESGIYQDLVELADNHERTVTLLRARAVAERGGE